MKKLVISIVILLLCQKSSELGLDLLPLEDGVIADEGVNPSDALVIVNPAVVAESGTNEGLLIVNDSGPFNNPVLVQIEDLGAQASSNTEVETGQVSSVGSDSISEQSSGSLDIPVGIPVGSGTLSILSTGSNGETDGGSLGLPVEVAIGAADAGQQKAESVRSSETASDPILSSSQDSSGSETVSNSESEQRSSAGILQDVIVDPERTSILGTKEVVLPVDLAGAADNFESGAGSNSGGGRESISSQDSFNRDENQRDEYSSFASEADSASQSRQSGAGGNDGLAIPEAVDILNSGAVEDESVVRSEDIYEDGRELRSQDSGYSEVNSDAISSVGSRASSASENGQSLGLSSVVGGLSGTSVLSDTGDIVGDLSAGASGNPSEDDLIKLLQPKQHGSDASTLVGVGGMIDGDMELQGDEVDESQQPKLLGIDAVGGQRNYDMDKMTTKYCDKKTGKCEWVYNKDLLSIGAGIMSRDRIEWTIPTQHQHLVVRDYESSSYTPKNFFGKGEPKSPDDGTCTDYGKCKKFHISPMYEDIESPHLYGTPFHTKKHETGIKKQIITQNFHAPGQITPTYAIENDNQYLQIFRENLHHYCPVYDNDGQCDAGKLMDQTAIYTLDELPCDIFYTALRLFDLDNDKNNALDFLNHVISLDDLGGAHWFKSGVKDQDVVEQCSDTDKLQKAFELLVSKYGDLDENAYFFLKQNYSSLCTPEKKRYKHRKCKNDRFYTYDGTCNNPDNDLLGRNPSSLLRIGGPHCTLDRPNKLPGARTASLTLGYITNFLTCPMQSEYNVAKDGGDHRTLLSLFALFFVQFVTHDIIQFKTRGINGVPQSGPRGCTRDGRHLPHGVKSPFTAPIILLPEDPYYGQFNATCMDFVTAQKYNGECLITDANIANFATAYLDLSQVYVKYECSIKGYIAPGGRIKESRGKFPHFDDARAFQDPLLTTITIVYTLYHNKIADRIKEKHNLLTDYEIFQYARLINIYVYQYYVDKYLLPAVLGDEYSDFQGITSTDSCYDPKLDPTPLTEFSSAIMRYFHRFLPNEFYYLYSDYTLESAQDFSRNYGGATMAFNKFASCFRGMTNQPMNIFGYAFQVQNSFAKFDHPFGMDVISLDIQRTRDTCIKPYIFYIKKFYGVDIHHWEDLTHYIPLEAILELKKVYKDVCHLELYAGIAVEKKYEKGLLGAVGRKVVTEQLLHTSCADKKHYKNVLDAETKKCFKKIEYNECFALLAGVKTTSNNILMTDSNKNRYYTITNMEACLEGIDCLIEALVKTEVVPA